MKDRLHNDTRPDSVPVVWAEAVCPFGRFRLRPEKRNHAACYQPTGPSDPNLIRTPCLLMQRTTSKEQTRRLISALLPASVIETHGAVAVENHLNMVLPKVAEPAIPLATLAAFFASQTADRVIRCINASVAVSASEIEAMPLPPADSVIEAMAETDPEAGLRRLYGIAE
jgi:adenine-specific DNA-methyltransferase